MKALILAAGRGSRMLGDTEEKPKCFIRLHGRRLLDWQVHALCEGGVADIGLVRGYLGKMFDLPLRYFDNHDWARTNMVRTLLVADEWLEGGTSIVSYSDIVYTPATVRRLVESRAEIALAYDPDWLNLWSQRFFDPLGDAETFRLDASGRLLTIGERALTSEEIQGQYMGLLKFSSAGWSRVRELLGSFSSERLDRLDMTTLLRAGLESGWEIEAVPVFGRWGEIDQPSDVELYTRLLDPEELLGRSGCSE